MNYRSFEDLSRVITNNIVRIPYNIDLVVGVPRSGVVPATMIGQLIDRPIAEIGGLVRGHIMPHGICRQGPPMKEKLADYRSILIVDDSICSGKSIEQVKNYISQINLNSDITYLAVFGGGAHDHLVDVVFERCPFPRVFQWNLISHNILDSACFDIDGVLCRDPSERENDDGNNYRKFISCAPTIFIPRRKVRRIVTSRLEKYRSETENWLASLGIQYDYLDMLNVESAVERRRLGLHAEHKATVYRKDCEARLFVESDPNQAIRIANLAGKPVIDFSNQVIYNPGQFTAPALRVKANSLSRKIHKAITRISAFGYWQ